MWDSELGREEKLLAGGGIEGEGRGGGVMPGCMGAHRDD